MIVFTVHLRVVTSAGTVGNSVLTCAVSVGQPGALKTPSSKTMSRARVVLDVLLMLLRRSSFMEDEFYTYLSSDASAIRGKDYFMTLEDRVPKSAVASIIDASITELEQWSDAGHVKQHVLPLALIGYGNASVAAKCEALFHAVKLDTGSDVAVLQRYSSGLISFCSDLGSECKITDVPALSIGKLLASVWKTSGLLLEPLALAPDGQIVEAGAGQVADDFGFGAACPVPGMKHLLDNLSSNMLKNLKFYPSFQEQLKACAAMLDTPFYRDRLVNTHFRDTMWEPGPKMVRWQLLEVISR